VVLGLTRQLGIFLVPRKEQLALLGPPLGTRLSTSLIPTDDQARLTELALGTPRRDRLAIFVIDEQCIACNALIDRMAADDARPVTSPTGLVALVKRSSEEFAGRAAHAFDLVITDPTGERTDGGGIIGTPYLMVVDEKLTIMSKDVVDDPAAAVQTLTRGAPAAHQNGNSPTGDALPIEYVGAGPAR
jgi:hypothetical protein